MPSNPQSFPVSGDLTPGDDTSVKQSKEALKEIIERLLYTTQWLRILSINILIITAASFFVPLVVPRSLFFGGTGSLSLAFMLPILAGVLLALFEKRRRIGNLLFQEISDELQWHLGESRNNRPSPRAGEAPVKSPDINIRVLLREFLEASELYFAPGNFGPLIYLILNLVIGVAMYFARYAPMSGGGSLGY